MVSHEAISLNRFGDSISASMRAERTHRLTEVVMSGSLPIDELRLAFDGHPTDVPLVVSAPTGSGKSTQIPRWCAQRARQEAAASRSLPKPVLVVEPRRVACRSLAVRVAELENVKIGEAVGYTVRDEDRSTARTLIRFVTTGVALRLWSADRLQGFSAVIIDEFHERNLELDLLLALCQAHPQTQLIVMSATFAAESLAAHLKGVHLSGSGKRFEVQLEYRSHGNTAPHAQGLIDALIPLIDEAFSRAPTQGGDVLVFLPGKGEIHEAETRLHQRWRAQRSLEQYEALPLHGGLSLDEQAQVFTPSSSRRVILATNVAETSLTVPKVSVVIDSGLVRRTRYDRGRGALTLAEIAQDSAEQRRGRAGRLGPGLCIRMWSQGAPMKAYTPPEIHRESLTSLLLSAAACGVDPRTLPFVDAPKPEALQNAEEVLRDLSAIDERGALTPCGEALFKLGVDVSLGRWLVEGLNGGPLRDLIDLVSALSCRRNLFLRGVPDDPSFVLRAEGCDAIGLIRAMRVPLHDARRYHLNHEVLREAHQNRSRLCRGLNVRQHVDLTQKAELESPIDRRALALALLRADPRCAYVYRARRNHEVWCGLGPELTLSQESGLALARLDNARFRCEALLVLERHAAVKRGRHAQHLIISAMPVPLAWFKSAGLGEDRLGQARLNRGELTVEIERVFAKKVLETKRVKPQGRQARVALTQCILTRQRWPKLSEEIAYRLNRLALSRQLRQQESARRGSSPRGKGTTQVEEDAVDVECWLEQRLEDLGFEEVEDLALITRDDLLPDALPDAEAISLDKAFPATLNLSDAQYVFHYHVSKRRAIMEQVSGSRRSPPRVEWLPKCGGFEVRFKRGQHDSALRARKH